MNEKIENRNVIRTRRMIRAAFVELLHEKPFEKITATDIINRADINRSTFYSHYKGMEGMVDDILNEDLEQFRSLLEQSDIADLFENTDEVLRNIRQFAEENQELYRLLGKSPFSTEKLEILKAALVQQIMESPNLRPHDRDILSGEVRVRMFMNGIVDTYLQWLAGDIPCKFDDLVHEMIGALEQHVVKDL